MFHLYEASEKLGAVNDHITPLINRGRRVYNFFTQPVYETVDFYKQIICLFCIGEGYADKIQMEHLDLFFRMMFDVSFTKFYLTSDKSLFLNTDILTTTFINYDFELIKPIVSNFCENYSKFFKIYIQKILSEKKGDDIRYKELVSVIK